MASTGEAWRNGLVAALSCVLLVTGWRAVQPDPPPRTAESALASLTDADLEEPDTAALALRAAAALGDEARVRDLAARLDRLAIRNEGAYGWGLSFAWDAYQDGSTNPATTIYTYTTAQAGLALLDAYDLTGDAAYRHRATRAAGTILDHACCWGDGAAVWYSDQPTDQASRGYVTPNVSGISAALFLRLGGRFADAGHRLTRELVAARQGYGWPYQYGAEKMSDLLHLTFVLDGLAADPNTRTLAMDATRAALREHFAAGLEPHGDFATQGSHGWGPPALLAVLRHVDPMAADLLARRMAADVAEWPGDVAESPRARAWYAYALAG